MTPLSFRFWHEGLNPDECVSVDGDAPGRLHLSHWPGHRTPQALRHKVSTGSCLMLARHEQRATLLQGITTVTNNHWDTDGLCSVFAVVQPALALEHGPTLVAAAMAGDFDEFTTPEGVKINLTLAALTKHPHSPMRTSLFGTELEARQAQYEHGLKLLPSLLANPDLHADWFAREYWTIQRDMRAMREDHGEIHLEPEIDLVEIRGDRLYHPVAVNTNAPAGAVLNVVSVEGGWLYDLRLNTTSWFDLPPQEGVRRLKRRDWGLYVPALNMNLNKGQGQWVADDWRLPIAHLRYVDNRGELVPNNIKPGQLGSTLRGLLLVP
ncbi:MAG: hypothetical protein KF754_03455 [Planctomycetes bacterium]|nr:hypothetical protein [Planctomycetota bacterium]